MYDYIILYYNFNTQNKTDKIFKSTRMMRFKTNLFPMYGV